MVQQSGRGWRIGETRSVRVAAPPVASGNARRSALPLSTPMPSGSSAQSRRSVSVAWSHLARLMYASSSTSSSNITITRETIRAATTNSCSDRHLRSTRTPTLSGGSASADFSASTTERPHEGTADYLHLTGLTVMVLWRRRDLRPPPGGSGTGSRLLHYFSTNRVDSRGLRWIPVDSTAADKRLTSNVLDHKLRVVSQLPKHARMGSCSLRRHRPLISLPHLDTPHASTLSQSSVQKKVDQPKGEHHVMSFGSVVKSDFQFFRSNRLEGATRVFLLLSHAVWLYHRFGLSFRDVQDLLAELC